MYTAPTTSLTAICTAWRLCVLVGPGDDLGAGAMRRDLPEGSDPHNGDLQGNLYAPDVTIGPDGRYYLYYVLSNVNFVSVAVCDTPAGAYEFYGYVHYPDGTLLGLGAGDEAQFDPGVLTENGRTYLYTGFCGVGDPNKHGAMATVLDARYADRAGSARFRDPQHRHQRGHGL